MLRTLLLVILVAAGMLAAPASAQPKRPAESPPTWSSLSDQQREALSPLAGQWSTLTADRKRKWLDIAEKYPRLSPDGKARLHARMAEFSRLTPEQRQTARENFQRAYELPRESRESAVQQYKTLPPEKRNELSSKGKRKDADAK